MKPIYTITMEALNEVSENPKKTFMSHVFSTTEESKAEFMNILQYAFLAIIPIVALNKTIHHFIPEADHDKSNLELLVEVLLQVTIMFVGIVLIHRVVTYLPTYSGFKYDNLTLTNVIIAFLVVVLSIQTKLGIKVNILVERVNEMLNGREPMTDEEEPKQRASRHRGSQADHLDNSEQQHGTFPPAPVATSHQGSGGYDHMMGGSQQGQAPIQEMFEPMAANGLVGGAFGASF